MGETQDIVVFSPKDLAILLVKQQGIREGHWGIYIEFTFSAGIFPVATPDKNITLLPAAISAIAKIGIHRFPESSPFTVDASEVNPLASADKPRPKQAQEKKD